MPERPRIIDTSEFLEHIIDPSDPKLGSTIDNLVDRCASDDLKLFFGYHRRVSLEKQLDGFSYVLEKKLDGPLSEAGYQELLRIKEDLTEREKHRYLHRVLHTKKEQTRANALRRRLKRVHAQIDERIRSYEQFQEAREQFGKTAELSAPSPSLERIPTQPSLQDIELLEKFERYHVRAHALATEPLEAHRAHELRNIIADLGAYDVGHRMFNLRINHDYWANNGKPMPLRAKALDDYEQAMAIASGYCERWQRMKLEAATAFRQRPVYFVIDTKTGKRTSTYTTQPRAQSLANAYNQGGRFSNLVESSAGTEYWGGIRHEVRTLDSSPRITPDTVTYVMDVMHATAQGMRLFAQHAHSLWTKLRSRFHSGMAHDEAYARLLADRIPSQGL